MVSVVEHRSGCGVVGGCGDGTTVLWVGVVMVTRYCGWVWLP